MARRQASVLKELRHRIVSRRIDPGELLPTRTELAQEFGVSVVTLQHVFDTLRDDGLIESRQRAGTFVNASPPFLTDYAVVFMRAPGGEGWSRFHQALHESALRIHEEDGKRILFYYDVDSDARATDYMRLMADSEAHRIAGQIFTTFSNPVTDPAFRPDEIPGVVIALPQAPHTGRAAVALDYQALWRQTADYLAVNGRRRVAILHESSTPDAAPDPELRAIFEARGLELPPHATIMLHPYGRQGAAQWVQLLMKCEASTRPDALFVADDNFTEPVIRGLVRAGVRVPEDLLVVTHNNFPMPILDVLPMAQVGFDADTILRTAMRYIDHRRTGQDVADVLTIQPQFQPHGPHAAAQTAAARGG